MNRPSFQARPACLRTIKGHAEKVNSVAVASDGRRAVSASYDGTMRVWDLPPQLLCNRHLVAEHFEIHTIWSVLTRGLKGWARHPETLRWAERLRALYGRHEADVAEMTRRGRHHGFEPASASTSRARRCSSRWIRSRRGRSWVILS